MFSYPLHPWWWSKARGQSGAPTYLTSPAVGTRARDPCSGRSLSLKLGSKVTLGHLLTTILQVSKDPPSEALWGEALLICSYRTAAAIINDDLNDPKGDCPCHGGWEESMGVFKEIKFLT